ncbi:MAG: hypothetical protein A3F67_02330 [Verrucomicrobia bacterium RIFCSPHIGHO2_12_FULL_41_10]|nr:MAG: hypothetical protein A3F67_02330 [Verrucomicrobia bacterium RIFCSPHIGHO2_12_FULL_41_10]
MRNLKATLLLGIITSSLVLFLAINGWFLPLQVAWQGMLHFTATDLAASDLLQEIMIVLLAFATIGVSLKINSIRERFLLIFFMALLVMTGSLVVALYHFFISPFPGEVAIALGAVMAMLFLQTAAGSRQPLLQRLFGQRLCRSTFQRLVDGAMSLEFLGELKNGSIMVCSINNHKELIESLTPEEYVEMTNLYLITASDFLVDAGGYLDECSGESLRVVFGVPIAVEGSMNHGAKAASIALDLLTRLDELNRTCDARWQKRLSVCIGINSGEMVAAAYGGNRVGHYSVAGPTVEFARYLCAACASYGCRILVGPATYEMAEQSVECRPIDLLQRKGFRRRVELYEILAPKDTLSSERERSRDLFWQGVIFFREQEWEKAVAAFASARISGLPDKVLDLYLERVDRARRGAKELTPEQAVLAELL